MDHFEDFQAQLQKFKCKKLSFKQFGDPTKVVTLEDGEVLAPYANEVLIKMLLVPVHPADINIIQGKYPVKPELKLPTTPGIEGIGEVIEAGFNATGYAKGDLVITNGQTIGTWTTHYLCQADDVIKVPKSVPLEMAAGLAVNMVTAHRMLTDFVELGPGALVIQNGANSACGQNVIQLCRRWGLVSVNIVRNRPKIEELKKYLTSLGANYVYTEEEFRAFDPKKPPFSLAKLALNCVGGATTTRMISFMAPGATMVTYGGMSFNPVTIPTSSFIFQDLNFRGFWLKKWYTNYRNSTKKGPMMEELFELSEKGYLKPPVHKCVPLKQFMEALENTLSPKGFIGIKYMIDFRETDKTEQPKK